MIWMSVGSEGDDVKADVAVVGASGQVVMGSRYDSLLLWRCDRLGRFPMGSTRAVTDFDENQRFAHFCNKIDFADATTEVAIDDSIASLAQKLRPHELRPRIRLRRGCSQFGTSQRDSTRVFGKPSKMSES